VGEGGGGFIRTSGGLNVGAQREGPVKKTELYVVKNYITTVEISLWAQVGFGERQRIAGD